MKNKFCLILLSSTMLVSCIKETKTVTKESSGNNYETPPCVYTGTCVGNTTGGSTGGWTGSTGGWTGTTTGSGGTGGDADWGNPYPGGTPTGGPCELSGEGFDTRKANLTSSGIYNYYNPANSVTQNYTGTDAILKTVSQVKILYQTDALLKVRFKALPEPQSAGSGGTLCYGRVSGSTSLGYTKMKIWPTVIGVNDNNTTSSYYPYPAGLEINVNNCSPAIDLSSYKSMHPNGVYVIIDSVSVNTGAGTEYSNYGVPHTKCWSLQFEVAADGTKTFN